MPQRIEPLVGWAYLRTDRRRRTGNVMFDFLCRHTLRIVSVDEIQVVGEIVSGPEYSPGHIFNVLRVSFTDQYFEPIFEA